MYLSVCVPGKGRLYPAYSLSGSEGEADPHDSPTHYRSLRRPVHHHSRDHHTHGHHHSHSHHSQIGQQSQPQQNQQQQSIPVTREHTYQTPFHQANANSTPYHQTQAGLSDTPTSENASDATLTDSELALARDSTLLVHNGKLNIFY